MSTESSLSPRFGGVDRFADFVILLAIFWLRLPAAFGSAPPSSVRILSLVPLAIGVAVLLPNRRIRRGMSVVGTLAGVYAVLIIIALFRGEAAGAYETVHQVLTEAAGILLVVWFCYLYFASAYSDSDRDRRTFILCCAPGVYVAINVFMHLGGVGGATTPGEPSSVLNAGTPGQLLGLVGIHSTRVLFPLANGINNFGDIAGVALTLSVILVMCAEGHRRKVAAVLALISTYALLAADSRGALLFSVAAVVLALLFAKRRWLTYLPLAVPFTTFITTFILGSLSNTSLVGTFSRNGSDLTTGTNRTEIWEGVLSVLSHPVIGQLYGYGANGQISSGASLHYDYLFFGAPHPDQYTAHNFMLQTVLDIGYLGLLVFVVLLLLAARRLRRLITTHGSVESRALLGVLVFFVFAGATDGAPSLYTPETLYFLLLLVTSVAAVRVPLRKKAATYSRVIRRHDRQARAPGQYQTT